MGKKLRPKEIPIHTSVKIKSKPKYFEVCKDGISLITDYGVSKTREIVIPREIFVEAWRQYIPCINKNQN